MLCFVLLFVSVRSYWIENKGLWYYISPTGQYVTYPQATAMCESMNSRLAVITNDDQNDFIENSISDREPRWIGLSNMKTPDHKANDNCHDKDYVWNYDIFCYNVYSNIEKGKGLMPLSDCRGVIFSSGLWTANNNCTNSFGFICQWECKTFHIQFKTLDMYNGLYSLHHYLEHEIVFVKDGDSNYTDIYKTKHGNKFMWELAINYMKAKVIATYESDSYVPYNESMHWREKINGNQDIEIDSSSFCIDCDSLSLCVDTDNNEIIHFDNITLNKEQVFYYVAVVGEGTALIRHNITQSCVDVTIQAGRIHACDYIFPYPEHTTRIDVNTTNVLYIQNNCVPFNNTCPREKETTLLDHLPHTSSSTISYEPTNEATADSPLELDDQMVIPVVIIGATVAVIVIITVVVLILIFIVRRRRRRSHTDNHTHQIQYIDKDKYDNAKYEHNEYSQMSELGSNMTNKDHKESVSNGAEYSYANLPVRETQKVATELSGGNMLPNKNEPLDTKSEGFLANDCGALMTGNTHDAKDGNMHNSPHGINAIYSQVQKPKITFPIVLPDSINMVKHNYNDDLQLCENDLYIHTTANDQQSEPPGTHAFYNEKGTEDGYGRYALNPNSEVTQTKIPLEKATNSPTRIDAQNKTTTIVSPDNVHNSDNDLQLHENQVYMYTTENNQQGDPPANHTYYNENNIHGLDKDIDIDKLNPNTAVTDSSVVDCGYYNIGDVKNDTGDDDLELFENSTYESSK